MNRPLIFIIASVAVAFVLIQVEAQFPGLGGAGFAAPFTGRGYNSAGARAVNDYYQNYYKRYNAAQAIRAISSTTNGIRMSTFLSLGSLLAIALLATNATGTLAG